MMPLAMAKEGSIVKINCVRCGLFLKKRLCDLGLYDKTEVKVVKNEGSGPMILQVKDSKLVIGRGQAMQIMVENDKDN